MSGGDDILMRSRENEVYFTLKVGRSRDLINLRDDNVPAREAQSVLSKYATGCLDVYLVSC